MMTSTDRAEAINRAKRALKALADHPETSRKQLGSARDRFNDCYRLAEAPQVWDAVAAVENSAARVYGVPRIDELGPTAEGAVIRKPEAPALAESPSPAVVVAR